jgi:arsenite-transporting ATPase
MAGLLERRILFVGGKGGVGKTTTAAALALLSTEQHRKCLLVSTDPAHSLGDIFMRRIGDQETALAPGLWGLEIDPDAAAHRYLSSVKANMRSLVAPSMYDEIERHMDLARSAPGSVEAALLERIAELMTSAQANYDLLIFDTAPTGHTLRLLSLPEMMAAWTEALIKNRERTETLAAVLGRLRVSDGSQSGDDISCLEQPQAKEGKRNARIREILLERRRKFQGARRLLLDWDTSAFTMVLNPEKLPLLESKTTLQTLRRFKVPVAAVIVNRILPKDVDGDFLRCRREQEAEYLAEIEREFYGLQRLYVPLLPHDVLGIDTLTEIGRKLASQLLAT